MNDAARYRLEVQRTPRPTGEQIERFAYHLANDHSWYKKLPLDGDGEPFFVYLHPHIHEAFIDREVGSGAWREFILDPENTSMFPRYLFDLRDGDVDPNDFLPLHHYAKGMTTSEYHERLGRWTYWNYGPPDQPRDEALQNAAASLRIPDDAGNDMLLPPEALELGLVYLRATVSPSLGPCEDDYEKLRRERDLPEAGEDRAQQIQELVTAMQRFAAWAYGD